MNIILSQVLEENIVNFVKNELKKLQRFLGPEYFESHGEVYESTNGEEEEQMRSSRKAFLEVALQFMRRMKQEELADFLQNSKRLLLTYIRVCLKLLFYTPTVCSK